jgi:hypothetical protein
MLQAQYDSRGDPEFILTIDGQLNASPQIFFQISESSSEILFGANKLLISPAAERRGYEIGLITVHDVFSIIGLGKLPLPSNTLPFFVNAASGPKCPRLTSISPNETRIGESPVLTVIGQNFQPDATIQVSGEGLTCGPVTFVSETELRATGVIDFNAQTGLHEVRIVTIGGTSNRGFIKIAADRHAPVLQALLPNYAVPGEQAEVELFGENFHPASAVVLSAEPQPPATEGRQLRPRVRWRSSFQLTTGFVFPQSFPLGGSTLDVTTIGGTAQRTLRLLENNRDTPRLRGLEPGTVMKGTNVFVLCEGINFARVGSGRSAFSVFAFGEGVASAGVVRPPIFPTELTDRVVFNLAIDPVAGPRAAIGVVTPEVLNSNALQIAVVDPLPGQPVLTDFAIGQIDAGTEQDERVTGRNLHGVNTVRFTVPGLSFSNIIVNDDGTAIDFHVSADASVDQSWRAATNLWVESAAGESNLIGYLIK